MMGPKRLRPCAAAAVALLATACTYKYNYRIELPPEPGQQAAAAAPRCSMVWSGVVPSGWTVAELRRFVDSIPATGCPKVELKVHRSGAAPDWGNGLADPVPDWVVRSALTQYAQTGKGPLRLIHAFAEPAAHSSSNPQPSGPTDTPGTPGTPGGGDGGGPSGNVPARPQAPNGDGSGTDGNQPDEPKAPNPEPPGTPTGPVDDPPGEGPEGGPAGGGEGPAGPSAWVARNAPPALVGGGVVYGLVYMNLLGVPAAGRLAPRGSADLLRRRRDEEEMADTGLALVADSPTPMADRRVRIRSSGFESPPA